MRRVLLAALGALVAACGGAPSCPRATDGTCPDLLFGGRQYVESRVVRLSPTAQELGDGTYPACSSSTCEGPDLGGFGATDVWRLEGSDPADAVIGLRQGTRTAVVFVRAP